MRTRIAVRVGPEETAYTYTTKEVDRLLAEIPGGTGGGTTGPTGATGPSGPAGPTGATGPAGSGGDSNLDGGTPSSVYGGADPIDGGGV